MLRRTVLFRLLFLVLSIFLSSYNSSAQKLILKQYTPSEGLPSSQVYTVFQDSRGYMWFATDAGVCRFNGSEFKTFTTNDGLADNTVFSFFEDPRQRIWMRSVSGKICYFENNKFIALPCNAAINSFMSNGVLASIYVDSKDTLWLGFTLNDSYLKIAPPYTAIQTCRLFHSAGGRYIRQINKESFIFGVSATNASRFSILMDRPFRSQVCFEIDQRRACGPSPIAIGTSDGGYLISLDNELYCVNEAGAHLIIKLEQRIISLMSDSEKNLWIGCLNGGLYCVPFDKTKKTNHYLPSISVSKVVEDKEHGYWISTLNEGVFYSANIHIQYYDTDNGFGKEPVSLCSYANNTLAVGCRSGELDLFSDASGLSRAVRSDPATISSIDYLTAVGKDTLMVAGQKGSFLFCPGNKWMRVKNKNGSELLCKNTAANGHGALHCIQYTCVAELDLKSKLANPLFRISQRANAIYSKGDKIWLGTINGLLYYNGKALEDWSLSNPLLRCRIVDIKALDSARLLLVSRDSGLLVLTGKNVRRLGKRGDLPAAIYDFALPVSAHEVWTTSNLGLHQIRLNDSIVSSVTNFTTSKGLLSNEVYQMARVTDLLYVTCKKGLMVMFPGFDRNYAYAPPVYVNSLVVNEKEAPLKKEYQLAWNENYISLSYYAVCYKGKNEILYRYKLKGDAAVWQYTKASTLSFPGMSPGDYQLHIEAKGPDGVWNTRDTIDLHIFIDNPFWLKWWFFAALGLLLIAVTYAVMQRRYTRQLIQKQQEMAMNKRLANMQLSLLRAQMNPHFIFNAINSIQSFIIKNENKSARKYLGTFSKLLRNILEQSASADISLAEEIDTLKHYLDIESLRFDNLKFDIFVAPEIDLLSVRLPAMLIQPYVENAIWHGLMHKEGSRNLHIRFELRDRHMYCKIEDNGIGRAKSAAINAQKGGKRKSFGMNITNERLEMLNYQMLDGPHVQISDKYDASNEPAGTLVEIVIPVSRKDEQSLPSVNESGGGF